MSALPAAQPERRSAVLASLLFAVLSAAPFGWSTARGGWRFLGADDYLSPINIAASMHYAVFPYDMLNGAGVDQAFIVAMLPVYAFYYALQALGATPHFTTLLMLSLMLFAAQLSFFMAVRYFLARRFGYDERSVAPACAIGAILYAFSPYFIAEILPGHCMTLFMYALFPLVMRSLDELLVDERPALTDPIAALLLLAACSPSLANIGTLYVLLIVSGLYMLAVLLALRLPVGRTVLRYSGFVALPFLANAWWLVPHFYNLPRYIAVSKTHGGEMVNLVAWASKDASVANVFQGRPESTVYMTELLGHDYYINAFQSTAFLALTAFVVLAVLVRNRHAMAMALTAMAVIMLLKGVQPPFSGLFMWAYDHIPGFQVMRRPTAKAYGFFLFFFMACATFGIAVAARALAGRRHVRRVLYAALAAFAGYSAISFASTNSMKPFNIPQMYFDARDYLLKQDPERVLILPAAFGVRPSYRPAMNLYSGMDFLNELFRFPKITPNTFDLVNEVGYLRPTREIMDLARTGQPLCEAARGLGLSHILVRDDMAYALEEYPARQLIANLQQHPDVVPGPVFSEPTGARLAVFRMKEGCSGRLLQLRGNYRSFRYELLNPGKIAITIEGLQGPAQLAFAYDYNEQWQLFPDARGVRGVRGAGGNVGVVTRAYNDPARVRMDFTDIAYLFQQPAPYEASHAPAGYANAWDVAGAPRDVKLIMFYRPQAYLIAGIVATLATLLALALRAALARRRR